MSKKQLILLVSAIIILAIIVIIMTFSNNENEEPQNLINSSNNEEYTTQQPNGNKVNTSEALKKTRTELGYYIKNITMKTEDTQTIFKLDIQNQSKSEIKGKLVDVIFINKDGVEETKISLYIRNIKPGETITTQGVINSDITNVYDFKLKEKVKQ